MPERIAVVTGASRGIGYATALALHSRGHRVLAVSRSADGLAALKAACGDDRLEVYSLDIGQSEAVTEWIGTLSQRGLEICILVNNAGRLVNKPFTQISGDELRRVYEINVFGVFELVQGLMPYFSDDVHVVNIGSMGGVQGAQKFPGLSAYSSSKMALVGLTECWQEELGDRGWSFNCLCLGSVQTEMLTEAFPGLQAPVNPEDMAGFIAGFAEGAHKFIRGKVLPISSTTP